MCLRHLQLFLCNKVGEASRRFLCAPTIFYVSIENHNLIHHCRFKRLTRALLLFTRSTKFTSRILQGKIAALFPGSLTSMFDYLRLEADRYLRILSEEAIGLPLPLMVLPGKLKRNVGLIRRHIVTAVSLAEANAADGMRDAQSVCSASSKQRCAL